jgi:hypothetical protein
LSAGHLAAQSLLLGLKLALQVSQVSQCSARLLQLLLAVPRAETRTVLVLHYRLHVRQPLWRPLQLHPLAHATRLWQALMACRLAASPALLLVLSPPQIRQRPQQALVPKWRAVQVQLAAQLQRPA